MYDATEGTYVGAATAVTAALPLCAAGVVATVPLDAIDPLAAGAGCVVGTVGGAAALGAATGATVGAAPEIAEGVTSATSAATSVANSAGNAISSGWNSVF